MKTKQRTRTWQEILRDEGYDALVWHETKSISNSLIDEMQDEITASTRRASFTIEHRCGVRQRARGSSRQRSHGASTTGGNASTPTTQTRSLGS